MMEDLFSTEEAIDIRDVVELWESDYFSDSKRWLTEVSNRLEDRVCHIAEELDTDIDEFFSDNTGSPEEIKLKAEDLSNDVMAIIMKLQLVEKIAKKVAEYDFDV